jgi:hypothetical protein
MPYRGHEHSTVLILCHPPERGDLPWKKRKLRRRPELPQSQGRSDEEKIIITAPNYRL